MNRPNVITEFVMKRLFFFLVTEFVSEQTYGLTEFANAESYGS